MRNGLKLKVSFVQLFKSGYLKDYILEKVKFTTHDFFKTGIRDIVMKMAITMFEFIFITGRK